MKTAIAAASVEDAAEILELQRKAYVSEAGIYGDCRIEPLTQTLESVREQFADHLFLKAVADGRIVGSVRACRRDGRAEIGKLIVDPECQGRGIGTRLMREIEVRFAGMVFVLFTGHKSERNLRLYRKLGYVPFDEKPVSPALRLIYLRKEIPTSAADSVNSETGKSNSM
jgi:ribosomal protein S18 acetylase RimI-like enzyme